MTMENILKKKDHSLEMTQKRAPQAPRNSAIISVMEHYLQKCIIVNWIHWAAATATAFWWWNVRNGDEIAGDNIQLRTVGQIKRKRAQLHVQYSLLLIIY